MKTKGAHIIFFWHVGCVAQVLKQKDMGSAVLLPGNCWQAGLHSALYFCDEDLIYFFKQLVLLIILCRALV